MLCPNVGAMSKEIEWGMGMKRRGNKNGFRTRILEWGQFGNNMRIRYCNTIFLTSISSISSFQTIWMRQAQTLSIEYHEWKENEWQQRYIRCLSIAQAMATDNNCSAYEIYTIYPYAVRYCDFAHGKGRRFFIYRLKSIPESYYIQPQKKWTKTGKYTNEKRTVTKAWMHLTCQTNNIWISRLFTISALSFLCTLQQAAIRWLCLSFS